MSGPARTLWRFTGSGGSLARVSAIGLALAAWSCAADASLPESCCDDQPSAAESASTPQTTVLRVADGERLDATALGGGERTVFLFTRVDCPIANRYAPEMERIASEYGAEGFQFWLVYANPRLPVEEIDAHRAEYALTIPALFDPEHALVHRCEATITPEAAVFDEDGELCYLGRIDDQYSGLNQWRVHPRRLDLREALNEVLEGKPVTVARTEAVGCFLEDLR